MIANNKKEADKMQPNQFRNFFWKYSKLLPKKNQLQWFKKLKRVLNWNSAKLFKKFEFTDDEIISIDTSLGMT